MKIDKIMTIIIIIISVINIILIVLGNIEYANQKGFFDIYGSIVLLVAQCFNIVAIILKYIKGNLFVKGQRKILVSIILIILVTAFIPVKKEETIVRYPISDMANATLIEKIYASGVTEVSHKNLYGITIYEETEYLSSYT